jgi:hypothetical protein
MSDAPSITDTLTHPVITNETSLHLAEALLVLPIGGCLLDEASSRIHCGCP